MNALIILAHGFEEIEAVAVIDILRRAEIEVTVAGLAYPVVTSARHLQVVADGLLSEVSSQLFDVLILPGGEPGTTYLEASPLVAEVVLKHYRAGKIVAAICAAPRILFGLGLLDGRRVTCFPSVQDQLSTAKIIRDSVVEDGTIITARDAGASIRFALKIVAKLRGDDFAVALGARIGVY